MSTDINITPVPGMQPVTTDTRGRTNSTGTDAIIQSPDALFAQGEAEAAARDVVAAEAAVSPAIADALEGKAQGLDLKQEQIAAGNAERARLIAARQPAIEAARAKAKEAEDKFANHQFYDYLKERSTGDKIFSRLAIALNAGINAYLGIPGNELADDLRHRVERDFEKQKIALHSKEQIAKWRKDGVTDLYSQLQNELAALDVKQAKAYEAVGAKAESMALRAQIPEAQAKQNVVTAKLAEAASQKRLEAAQRYEKHDSSNKQTSSSTQTTSAHGSAVKPGSEDVKATTDVDDGVKTLDRLIADVEKHPDAWNEYRNNVEDWKRKEAVGKVPIVGQGRAIAQGAGAANVAPEQGLKTPEARRIHQQQESLNTALAKKMGGVITEGDVARVMSQQSNMALSPKEKLEQLKQFRDDLVARRKAYETNRNVAPGTATAPVTTTGETPGGTPNTNRLVRIKSGPHKGRVGKVLDNGKIELLGK